MNPTSSPTSDLAAQLIARAAQFARDALGSLPPGDPESGTQGADEARTTIHLQLQTHFLFPQLSESQRALLVTLYWERQTLTGLVNIPCRTVPEPLRTQAEQVTSAVEQSFMTLAEHIKGLVGYQSLSSVQRTIFEREYVLIRFSDMPE